MKPSAPARKVLHITYFVDPGQQRQIKIPLYGVRLIAIMVAAVAITIFSSLFWLFSPFASEGDLIPLLESIAASINLSLERDTTLAAAAGARAGLGSAQANDVESTWHRLPTAGPVKVRQLASAESKLMNNTIAIATPTFEYDREGLVASFTIVNHGPKTAHGTVWGTASFETDSGEVLQVGSHTKLDLSALDDMRHIEQGISFKAKNQTNKSLVFKFPREKTGRFIEVRVAAGERIRAQLIVATFALDSQ